MNSHTGTPSNDDEPTADELNEIERESGILSAEMALLDAEIRIMTAERQASDADWRRLRRAVRAMLREAAGLYLPANSRATNDHPDSPEEYRA